MVTYLFLLSDLPLYIHLVAWPTMGVTWGSPISPVDLPVSTFMCYPSALLTGKEQRTEVGSGLSSSLAKLQSPESSFLSVEQCAEWPFRHSDAMQQARSPKFPLLDDLGQGIGESAHQSQNDGEYRKHLIYLASQHGDKPRGLGPRNQTLSILDATSPVWCVKRGAW